MTWEEILPVAVVLLYAAGGCAGIAYLWRML
jgi:hypothetical protein